MNRDRRSPRGWRHGYKQDLHKRFLLRFHMFLILAAVIFSGMLMSRGMWALGLRAIHVRYPIAVAGSYLVFFVLIRIWLYYIEASDADEEPIVDGEDAEDGIEALGYMAMQNNRAVGNGIGSAIGRAFSSDGNTTTSSDGDGDSDYTVILLIAAGAVLVAVFGASLYLVWEAPAVLGEAALQMVLATTLTRAARRMDEPGWAGSILSATWIPFVVVLCLSGIFGAVVIRYCPGATRMSEVLLCK